MQTSNLCISIYLQALFSYHCSQFIEDVGKGAKDIVTYEEGSLAGN